MKRRLTAFGKFMTSRLRPAAALRECLHEGYALKDLWADVLAGLLVALVAIPLGLALAIASGVAPQFGLVTVVIGGFIAAILGGSRYQVSGPTAAFVALLLPVVEQHGFAGLLLASMMAGLIMMSFGLLGLGQAIAFVPYPVVTGFTSGIALVIASLQVKDLLGMGSGAGASHFFERLQALADHLDEARWQDLSVGLLTLLLIAVFGRFIKRVPAPILALSSVTALAAWASRRYGFQVSTLGSRFSYQAGGQTLAGIPSQFPAMALPWARDGVAGLNWGFVREVFPSALAIALLGSLESLLSAVVADGMTRKKHEPDAELLAIGTANVVAPFFGGLPATGAIARTATNIRFGARSPIAAASHALWTLLIMLLAAPYMSELPMAGLAALLLVVAWNMSERHHFINILRVGRWGDRSVLLACFGLTVAMDMTVGVLAGMLLAAFMLVRRVAEMSETRLLGEGEAEEASQARVPKGTLLYQIRGPLLFGAAHQAMQALLNSRSPFERVVIDLHSVHSMDITGLNALETCVRDLRQRGKQVCLARGRAAAKALVARSQYFNQHRVRWSDKLQDALQNAKEDA